MTSQIAGIIYGAAGVNLHKLESELIQYTNDFATLKKMLQTKLYQLDILDQAINKAQSELSEYVTENEKDLNTFMSIVGCVDDHENAHDNSLWGIHNKLVDEIYGTKVPSTNTPEEDEESQGIIDQISKIQESINTVTGEIKDCIKNLTDIISSSSIKDNTGNTANLINNLVDKLNELLVKYTDSTFDISEVQETNNVDNLIGATTTPEHDHSSVIVGDCQINGNTTVHPTVTSSTQQPELYE